MEGDGNGDDDDDDDVDDEIQKKSNQKKKTFKCDFVMCSVQELDGRFPFESIQMDRHVSTSFIYSGIAAITSTHTLTFRQVDAAMDGYQNKGSLMESIEWR